MEHRNRDFIIFSNFTSWIRIYTYGGMRSIHKKLSPLVVGCFLVLPDVLVTIIVLLGSELSEVDVEITIDRDGWMGGG
jgi:hypothetical protein